MTEDVDHGQLAARGALLLAIRGAGVHDVEILRAFEAAPREEFAPYRFRDLANRDISLPIGWRPGAAGCAGASGDGWN